MRRLGAALLAAAAAAAGAAAEGDGALGHALAAEDECRADDEAAGCGLSAIQRRGLRRSGFLAATAHEAAHPHIAGWVQSRRCLGDQRHELAFVIRPKGLDELEALALDLTNPSSANYRRWISRDEVSRLARNEAALLELHTHLAGFPELTVLHESRDGDVVRVHGPVSSWESLLGTEFFVYRHPDHEAEILRAPSYFLPGALEEHVVGVLNAVDFEELRPHTLESRELLNAAKHNLTSFSPPSFGWPTFQQLAEVKGDSIVTPTKLREIYNVQELAQRGSKLAQSHAKTWQVVFGTLSQHWSPADRTKFEEEFKIPQDNYVKQIQGEKEGFAMSGDETCRRSPNMCAEANLDIQYMMGMSPWSEMGYWYSSQANAAGMYGFLTDFVARFVDVDKSPQVISISYGMPEYLVTRTSLLLFEVLAMKMALQGVTILAASGDDGAASFLARKEVHGQECWSVPLIGLQVSWPASSQWVTAVGATLGPASGNPEVVCQVNYTNMTNDDRAPLITSGGGFSQAFKVPPWQAEFHNKTARGVPDLSLLGHDFAMVVGQRWLSVDGTSASAPTLGGMLSLINAELLEAGRPPIGFLNQLIYTNTTYSDATSDVFHDVTEGDNKCAALGYPCCGGYEAGPGWDPVTGLGSPDWKKLRGLIWDTRV